MTTTPAEIDTWRKVPREHHTLEFKAAKTDFDKTKLYRYCVAIANEGGGKLILGIADTPPRQVVGTAAFPSPQAIAEKLLTVLNFRVDVEEVLHPDNRVVVFHIPSRPKGTAYNYQGAYLMRSGEELVSMSEDRLRQIFDEGKPDWLSEISKTGCSSDDIVRLLDTQSYYDLQENVYPSTRDEVLRKFEDKGFIQASETGWNITRMGGLLFAKRIEEFPDLQPKIPRVIVYEGMGKLRTRLDQQGPKGYAVGFSGLIDFIMSQTPQSEVMSKALRKEIKMFPEDAVRELVANALIHQDFQQDGPSVRVEMYEDRIEVSNLGLPPISTERFIDEDKSRNERLAEIMRRLRICERKGSGFDRVVDAAEVYQLPAPDIRLGEVRTSVILYAHKSFNDMDRDDRIRATYQHCCLRFVMRQKMTNQSLRNRFQLPDNKTEPVSRAIRDTLDAKYIKVADPTVTSTRYRSYIPFWA
jgi:ATP-dependent DNA helicase RecG